MNPVHLKLVLDSISESRTYDYNGYEPYSAADLCVMDSYVDDFFTGSVPTEILKNGGVWDAEKRVLWMPGKAGYALFKEVR